MKSAYTTEVAQELTNLFPVFHRKLVKPFGNQIKASLPPTHFITLKLLEEKDAKTMKELAEQLSLSKQQLTPIIENLFTKGYVTREHDIVDRRNINIYLTKSGLDFIESQRIKLVTAVEEKLGVLNDDDLLTLNNALADLYRIFNKLP